MPVVFRVHDLQNLQRGDFPLPCLIPQECMVCKVLWTQKAHQHVVSNVRHSLNNYTPDFSTMLYLRLFFQRLVGDGRRLPNQSIDLAAEQPAGSWCMSVCLYVCNACIHASMHPCIHPSTDRWMHGCMDECMNVSYVMLCCIILYHIMLYYIILYYIILYYIIL